MDLKYWVGFNQVPGIGPIKFKQLLDHFGDAGQAWEAEARELKEAGLDAKAIENLLAFRQKVSLEEEIDKLSKAGIKVVTWSDKNYPEKLRSIHDPPPLLYRKGELLSQDGWAVAVVGTRSPRPYGRQIVEEIASDLARSGVTVVSGLARGIDSLAHRAALEAGGRTIAVLGSGIDVLYPEEHKPLAEAIIKQGVILSEYPLGTPPVAENFPRRNRLISGLALGTVIVEAGADSGALITADYALEQGRELFAVPGNVTSPKSRGTNKLIQEGGAKLIFSAADILEELNMTMIQEQRQAAAVLPQNETEALVLGTLSTEPMHVDEIGRQTRLPISQVTGTLALLELKGLVRQVGGMHYILAREARLPYTVD
ncbi:MAG: DNA-protecting protein DprA [Chloroflexi bacterium]|nr:DNA-protecting protein DprA [Chloroflexota bacterium]